MHLGLIAKIAAGVYVKSQSAHISGPVRKEHEVTLVPDLGQGGLGTLVHLALHNNGLPVVLHGEIQFAGMGTYFRKRGQACDLKGHMQHKVIIGFQLGMECVRLGMDIHTEKRPLATRIRNTIQKLIKVACEPLCVSL